jgi:hypothetical protein
MDAITYDGYEKIVEAIKTKIADNEKMNALAKEQEKEMVDIRFKGGEVELSEREVRLLRYTLMGGAAFCQHKKDVIICELPIFERNGNYCPRVGTERIIARYLGSSESKCVGEKVVSITTKF